MGPRWFWHSSSEAHTLRNTALGFGVNSGVSILRVLPQCYGNWEKVIGPGWEMEGGHSMEVAARHFRGMGIHLSQKVLPPLGHLEIPLLVLSWQILLLVLSRKVVFSEEKVPIWLAQLLSLIHVECWWALSSGALLALQQAPAESHSCFPYAPSSACVKPTWPLAYWGISSDPRAALHSLVRKSVDLL